MDKKNKKEELEKKETKDKEFDKSIDLVEKAITTQHKGKLPSVRKEAIDAFTDDALKKAEHMVKSGLLPSSVKNAQAALIIMQKGKELGLSPMSSFEHVIVINGKAGLDGAAMATLIKRGGVDWEVIKNAEEVYETDADGNIIKFAKGKNSKGESVLAPPTQEYIDKGKPLYPKRIDVETVIKFRRRSSVDPSKILEHTARFTYKDAIKAGLLEKDSWIKYFSQMLFWRTMTLGARQFAPDLLLGMHSVEELDTSGKVAFDESGNIII